MAPRFDMALFFATVDGLVRSTAPQPLVEATGPVTAADPLKMYIPKAWLIEHLRSTVTAMTGNLRSALKNKVIDADGAAEVRAEIDRRKAFIAQLRAQKSVSDVYMSLHPTKEFDIEADDASEAQPWN